MDWISRSDNDVADYISKLRDLDDWKVNPIIFPTESKVKPGDLLQLIVLHQIIANCQLERFHGKFAFLTPKLWILSQ